MQSELCSHIGLGANFPCRMCKVGGTQKQKATQTGFLNLLKVRAFDLRKLFTDFIFRKHKPGESRKVSETRDAINEQIEIASHPMAEKDLKSHLTTSGVKDSFTHPLLLRLIQLGKDLRKEAPGREPYSVPQVREALLEELRKNGDISMNPLLDMPGTCCAEPNVHATSPASPNCTSGFDVHLDTPVEPLHTHLLGIVKYFWGQTTTVAIADGKFELFQAQLNSLEQAGLNIPNIMADF